MGGVIIGHEMGRALGRPAMFVERPQGTFELRRGFRLEPGAAGAAGRGCGHHRPVLARSDRGDRGRGRQGHRRRLRRRPVGRQRRPWRALHAADPHRRSGLCRRTRCRRSWPRSRRSSRGAAPQRDPAAAPRRQHRPCRDHPERARRRSSRSGARRADRRCGRRRRHHRPPARRPPPHHRRRYRPADGRDRPAAEPGNGGDRGDAGDRARATGRTPPASSPKSARSAPPRAGSTPPGSTIICAYYVDRLGSASIRVSLFIEPDERQVEAALRLGAPVVELHTGRYAHVEGEERATELKRIADCAALAVKNGIEPHAGHGLTFDNVVPVAAIPQLAELNIGHFLIGEAIFTGLDDKRPPDARADGRARADDRRPRLRPVQHPADREIARALRRPLPQPRLHRPRARQGGVAAAHRAPARSPSASPPRKPSPRRSAPASSAACS